MATTPITPVALVVGTATADLPAVGTVATTPADGWVITPGAGGGVLLLVFEADGSGDTVTIAAGDDGPSLQKYLGADTVTLAASDLKAIIVESGRHMQNDGTILATCTDTGTRCYALKLPAGYAGGSGVA